MKKILPLLIHLFVVLSFGNLLSQDFKAGEGQENIISDYLHPSGRRGFYEVNEIRISGNVTYTDAEIESLLFSVKTSKGTLGIFHNQLDYLSKGIEKTGAPLFLDTNVTITLNKLESSLDYFNPINAEIDVNSIKNFYRTNGFHFVNVFFTFLPDSLSRDNILTFHIQENNRYTFGSITYLGLDSLPKEVDRRVRREMRLKKGNDFSEDKIIYEANTIHRLLKNRGYYFSNFAIDTVYIKEKLQYDSVRVVFELGKRVKIGRIDFVDSARGQPKVVKSLKEKMLTFESGDWYNESQLRETQNNFLALGIFNQVQIDTSTAFGAHPDSALNLVVYLTYRQQGNWSLGWFVNKTEQFDNWNMGLEGDLQHSNLFNAAQKGAFYSNVALKDLISFSNFSLNANDIQVEYNAGLNFSQPIAFILRNFRVGFQAGLQFSQSEVENFRVRKFAIPLALPIRFPAVNWIDQFDIQLRFEHENPINYDDFSDQSQNLDERFAELLYLYSNLDAYLSEEGNFITSSILTLNFIADHRDNLFNPLNGHYFESSFDFSLSPILPQNASGLAEYFRFSGLFTAFHSANRRAVHAFKANVGFILLYDQANNYVPTDRMFYSGGSNSIRGWQSRKLHYSDIQPELNPENPDSAFTIEDYNLFSNIIGSGVLLEGTYEIRYNFGKISRRAPASQQSGSFGMVAFMDIGNAFHWFVEGENTVKTDIQPIDYLKQLAVAAGLGARYNTSLGPLRLDIAWPIKGPVFGAEDRIWLRENPFLSNIQIHIGIGHAF